MRNKIILGGVLLVCLLSGGIVNSSSSWGGLPPSIENSLNEARLAPLIPRDISASSMWDGFERIKPATEEILNYARSSNENLDALANYIFDDFRKYNEVFGPPGKKIDVSLLKKFSRSCTIEEDPSHGFQLYAFLLLEMAKEKGSPSFTKKVLDNLYSICLSISNLEEQMSLYKKPNYSVEREKREQGGLMGRNPIYEIAWICEKFMVETYLSEKPFLPNNAMRIINSFWERREGEMILMGLSYSLPLGFYGKTMSYVKKLAGSLP